MQAVNVISLRLLKGTKIHGILTLSQIPAAVALLATISLWIVLLTRAPGINQQMTALLQACIAYGIAWVFTLIAALILVKIGAFDWLPARYAVVIVLHLAGGAAGVMGVMGLLAFESECWILPCVAFATVVPLLVQSAALNASFRPVLLVVIALHAVAVIAPPAGYWRVKMKERELAAYNANWRDARHGYYRSVFSIRRRTAPPGHCRTRRPVTGPPRGSRSNVGGGTSRP